MATIRLARLSSRLRQLRRSLLTEFFTRFEPQLGGPLPGPNVPDTQFFAALAKLVATPENLPEPLLEALFAIDEMSSPEGQEQIEHALAASAASPPDLPADCTRDELALRLWLADPALLARLHNRQRLRRLTAFECFGPPSPPASPVVLSLPPPPLETLAAALDPWFARHRRGHNTTRLELYRIEADAWFLVRHGDTFTRAPSVDAQKTEVIHFRPERDDVVVYSPRHDELRINARTRGERRLYVETFGLHLRGRADWFSRRRTYTLEPLRREGPDALDPAGLDGLNQIILRELELTSNAAPFQVVTRQSEDLFAASLDELMPAGWRLTCAGFDLHFAGHPRPRPLQIRPPNCLKLGRHCDLHLVDRWLGQRGFRLSGTEPKSHAS